MPLSKVPLQLSCKPFQVLEGCSKVPPEPSLVQADQPQLSQPVLVGEVFQPSDHCCGPPLDLLQQVHVFPVLRAPELDAGLPGRGVSPELGRGAESLPSPCWPRCWGCSPGCEHTLLGHVELLINQHLQVLLLRAAFNPFSAQPVFVLGIPPTHVQDLALGLVELHEVRMGLCLKAVQVPLDGISSLQRVDPTTRLGVISRLAEGRFHLWGEYAPVRGRWNL